MIYTKTELGQSVLQKRTFALTPRQRSAFILFDGKRSLDDVLKTTAGLGVTVEDISYLIQSGLVAAPEDVAPVVGAAVTNKKADTADIAGRPSQYAQDHYSRAYPIAARLTAGLGLRGFRLNLAVEAATDLAKLQDLAPKIRVAVGPEKYQELDRALYD